MVFRAPPGALVAPEERQRVADAVYERVAKLEPRTVGVLANEAEILVRVEAPPSLAQIEAFRARIEHTGSMRFSRLVETGPSKDRFFDERKAMLDWRRENSTGTPDEFQSAAPAEGGPGEGVRWFLQRGAPQDWIACDASQWSDPASSFTERDLDWRSIGSVPGPEGAPALGAKLRAERAEAFAALTGTLAGSREKLAILNDERVVVTSPVVNEALKGPFVVEGWFDETDLATAIDAWRSGARVGRLTFRPEFVAVR